MTTSQDIIKDALELIGVVNPEDAISDQMAVRGLAVLNQMLDEWASENLFVFQLQSVAVAVTAGIGTAAISRPWTILSGPATASFTPAGGTAAPVNVVSAIEFQTLAGTVPTAGTPDTITYVRDYPAGTVQLLPTPVANGTLAISVWNRLTAFADLYTEYVLPPGEADLLRDNLAVQLKAYFSDSQIAPMIVVRAAEEKMFFVYHGIVSRAMSDRFVVSAPKAQAQ